MATTELLADRLRAIDARLIACLFHDRQHTLNVGFNIGGVLALRHIYVDAEINRIDFRNAQVFGQSNSIFCIGNPVCTSEVRDRGPRIGFVKGNNINPRVADSLGLGRPSILTDSIAVVQIASDELVSAAHQSNHTGCVVKIPKKSHSLL